MRNEKINLLQNTDDFYYSIDLNERENKKNFIKSFVSKVCNLFCKANN